MLHAATFVVNAALVARQCTAPHPTIDAVHEAGQAARIVLQVFSVTWR